MDYNDTILDIAREFPHVDTIDLRSVLDDEVDHCEARGYERKIEESAALIRLWLKEAELKPDNMARFVAHHRRAYVWAALVREQERMKTPEAPCPVPDEDAYIQAARRRHEVDDEREIHDDALVSREEGGAFVQAWVWVSDEDLEGE